MVLIVLPDSGHRQSGASRWVATRRTYRHEEFAAHIYRFQNASTAFMRRRFSVVT